MALARDNRFYKIDFGGVLRPPLSVPILRGGNEFIKEKIQQAKLSGLRGGLPLGEEPFSDRDSKVAEYAQYVERQVERTPVEKGLELSLTDRYILVLLDCLMPINFQDETPRSFSPLHNVHFGLDANDVKTVRKRDALPTAGELLSFDPFNTKHGGIRIYPKIEEILIICVAILRKLNVDAYISDISVPRAPFIRESIPFPGITVLDARAEPYLRSFVMHGAHPPMTEITIYGDIAALSVVHALHALQRFYKFKLEFDKRAKNPKKSWLGFKTEIMPKNEFEAQIKRICEPLKKSMNLWYNSIVANEVLGALFTLVEVSFHGLIKEQVGLVDNS